MFVLAAIRGTIAVALCARHAGVRKNILVMRVNDGYFYRLVDFLYLLSTKLLPTFFILVFCYASIGTSQFLFFTRGGYGPGFARYCVDSCADRCHWRTAVR